MWCFYLMSEIDAQSLYIHRKHVSLAAIYGEAPQAVTAAQGYFNKHIKVVSDELREKQPGNYLLGEFSAVDVLLTHTLRWAKAIDWLPTNGDEQPLLEYLGRAEARDAFKKVFTEDAAV